MHRSVAIVGATSSIGIRPYDNGEPRHLYRAPGVLREQSLVERLRAVDLGDVAPPPYRDHVRPPGGARNEAELVTYSQRLAERVASATADRFGIVLGGDCSIVLGCLLGARRTAGPDVGLIYVDAHADFATPEESRTGSAASMCLAMAVGRGNTPLARLGGDAPLVDARKVAILGRRDFDEPWYGHDALAALPILDLSSDALTTRGAAAAAEAALAHVTPRGSRRFWIHVDADVLNPEFVDAVDSPVPGGPTPDVLADLLRPLVSHPEAIGLELTIYDPGLDPERASAQQLASLLQRLFATSTLGTS